MAKLDQVLLGPRAADGSVSFLRNQDGRVSAGVATPIKEGKPILGELVQFEARPEHPNLCDCKTLLEAQLGEPVKEKSPEGPSLSRHNGPERVTTPAYRAGWDVVFGQKLN